VKTNLPELTNPRQVYALMPKMPNPTVPSRPEKIGGEIMENANVSTCANPACAQEFKRLGEGKLFVRRIESDDNGLMQKALWLCPGCAERWDLRYDRRQREYHLVQHRRMA